MKISNNYVKYHCSNQLVKKYPKENFSKSWRWTKWQFSKEETKLFRLRSKRTDVLSRSQTLRKCKEKKKTKDFNSLQSSQWLFPSIKSKQINSRRLLHKPKNWQLTKKKKKKIKQWYHRTIIDPSILLARRSQTDCSSKHNLLPTKTTYKRGWNWLVE